MQARKHLNRLIGTALSATKEGKILSLLSHGLIPLKKKVIGIYRDDFRIWGCVGGYAAYTPPNPGTSTAIPNEPQKSTNTKRVKIGTRNVWTTKSAIRNAKVAKYSLPQEIQLRTNDIVQNCADQHEIHLLHP